MGFFDGHAEAAALPDHWSWFSLLPESWHDGLTDLGASAGSPVANALGNEDAHEKWFFGGHFDVLHVWGFLFVLFLVSFVGMRAKRRFSNTKEAIIPEDRLTTATFAELFSGSVLNLMASIMGKENAKYFLPLIGTCAFMIFFSNVLGLIPGFLPPTDNLNTTACMAIIIFLATHIYGVKKQGFAGHFGHMAGPVWYLSWLIFPIEVVSHFVRPVTLAIRLTANMFADHAVLGAFLGLSVSAFFLPFPVAIYFLGIIVVTVQTLVFCLLSMVYIGSAIEEHDHH